MQIIDHMEQLNIKEETAVAIGKFDGIHLGHQALLKEIITAKKEGIKSVIFTFYPSPAAVFGGYEEKVLTTPGEKREYFRKAGVDYFVEYPMNRQTAAVEPLDYIKEYLVGRMHAKLVVAGPDLSFGRQGKGDFSLLEKYSSKYGYTARQIEKVCAGGGEISSTRVRNAVKQGDMREAALCLGSYYSVGGTVLHGNELGRTMGFPTLNLVPDREKLLPPFGVYYSLATLEGRQYHGVTNIGRKPTVHAGDEVTVETNLFHYDGTAYGQQINVELMKFVRPERQFDDKQQLMEQIHKDVEQAEQYFSRT